MFTFPSNCKEPNSRWAFTYSLEEELRLWRNEKCQGMTLEAVDQFEGNYFNVYSKQISILRIGMERLIIKEKHWNPTPQINIVDRGNDLFEFKYPERLNQSNEGSKGAIVLELLNQYSDKNPKNLEVEVLHSELASIKNEARTASKWKPFINLEGLKHG